MTIYNDDILGVLYLTKLSVLYLRSNFSTNSGLSHFSAFASHQHAGWSCWWAPKEDAIL